MSVLVWMETVKHSDRALERFFLKKLILKKSVEDSKSMKAILTTVHFDFFAKSKRLLNKISPCIIMI